MDFSLMFFSSSAHREEACKYRLLVESAKFADVHGFTAVWTPERHFHQFGGLYPNPAVTSAALAVITRDIRLRAGSLVAPLHHPVRIAEDWSVVDNLSGGRAEISFAPGFQPNDFLIAANPLRFASRREDMWGAIDVVRSLWRGGTYTAKNGRGEEITVSLFPRPLQPELPVWITAAGNPETFVEAGARGFNVLTHLVHQDYGGLAEKIRRYRTALQGGPHSSNGGRVALMMHTFLGDDPTKVKDIVRGPLIDYLKTSRDVLHVPKEEDSLSRTIPDAFADKMVEWAFERYFTTGSLMGTPTSCRRVVEKVRSIGVDEISCLIDFIDDDLSILNALEYLSYLKSNMM
jgi:natural product biosynthesis luciferase-like monooxygenase protein